MIHFGSKKIFAKNFLFFKQTIILSTVYSCPNRQCQQKKNGKFLSNGSRVIKIYVHEFFWCTLYIHINVTNAVTLEPFVQISCVIARSKRLEELNLAAGEKWAKVRSSGQGGQQISQCSNLDISQTV